MIELSSCGLLALAALAVPAIPAAAAPPPPELAPLLQKTSELQLSTERFSGESTITAKKLPRSLKGLGGLTSKISGEISTSPEEASITETVLGRTISLRFVANALYIDLPTIAKHDGGRPWVKESEGPSGGLFGSNTKFGGGSGGSGDGLPTSRFTTEIALLKASNDVRSLGASTIDGQSVTGFAGTADPKEIEESRLPKSLRKAVAKAHIKPAATFEVFLAANGLPVRSHVVLRLGAVKLNVTQDVLAINFPVAAVTAPPAAETITGAELKKILARQLKKKKKK